MSTITLNIPALIKDKAEDKDLYRYLLDQVEPVFFEELLIYTNGNQSKAARLSGVNRETLAKRLKRHDISIKASIAEHQKRVDAWMDGLHDEPLADSEVQS